MPSTKKISPEDQLLRAVAIVIRKRREYLDLTQGALAREAGLHRSYITDLEAGRRNLSVSNLSRMAEALKMMPSKLVSFAEKEINAQGSTRAVKAQSSIRAVKAQSSIRAVRSQSSIRAVKPLSSVKPVSVALSGRPRRGAFAEPLSEAELDVLRLMARGFANKQIGLKLGVALDTVKSRIKRIMAKLNVHNRTAAATIYLLQMSDGQGV